MTALAPGTEPPAPPRSNKVLWIVLGFALVFPTLIGWAEFLAASPEGAGLNLASQLAYGSGLLVQVGLPLLGLWVCERRLPRLTAPRRQGLALGLGFGLLVAAGIFVLYYGILRDTPVFATSSARMHAKLREFGLDSAGGFAVFAFFIAVPHSLLEEYYWRWFVFGRLRQRLTLVPAIALSSTAFMAPHVFALATFLGGALLLPVLAFTLCVGAGGAIWAWLYHRSGSLYAPWLSHLVVDAALFVVGHDLFFVRPG
jgi:membrane protease YdiL (CAAX protease family)